MLSHAHICPWPHAAVGLLDRQGTDGPEESWGLSAWASCRNGFPASSKRRFRVLFILCLAEEILLQPCERSLQKHSAVCVLCVEVGLCVLCAWGATCAMVLIWKPEYRCFWTYSLRLSFRGFWILNSSHVHGNLFLCWAISTSVFLTALAKALKNWQYVWRLLFWVFNQNPFSKQSCFQIKQNSNQYDLSPMLLDKHEPEFPLWPR